MLPLSCHAGVSRNAFCSLLDVVKAFSDVVKLPVHLLGMNGGFNDGCR
jgi:hypothetical protein